MSDTQRYPEARIQLIDATGRTIVDAWIGGKLKATQANMRWLDEQRMEHLDTIQQLWSLLPGAFRALAQRIANADGRSAHPEDYAQAALKTYDPAQSKEDA